MAFQETKGAQAGNGETTSKRNKNKKWAKDKLDAVVGRKDQEGQEGIPDLTALKKGMPKAIKVEKEMADMRHDASEFYKKFAKESNLNAATLRAAAKSYANEEREAAMRRAEQTTLIFEECGDQ